jgi:hypothetical protein
VDVAPLRCRRTLSEVLGPEPVFVPRPSFSGQDFLRRPRDDPDRHSWTANFLSVLGDLDSVCAVGAATPEALELLSEAGLPHRPRVLEYRDAASYLGLVRSLARRGRRLVLQHIHPANEIPRSAYWIDRKLLGWLNNKANLPRLVPAAYLPQRRVVRRSSLGGLDPSPTRPLVLKVATPWSSGGGIGVAIVRGRQQLRGTAKRLAPSRWVVVERMLPFVRTLCLTYAGNDDGIEFLGAPEQIVDEHGRYEGSWFSDRHPPDEAVEVGREIMTRAVTWGYRGIAGFDCGLLKDGRVVVFDLNFRLCGSTPGLLWFGAAAERWGRAAAVAKNIILTSDHGFPALLSAVHRALRQRHFLPLALMDGQATMGPTASAWARGLVVGATRLQVEARHRRLAAALESR